MSRQLVWLRADLRIHDNPALYAASQAGSVVAVFVFTPVQWQAHGWGLRRQAWVHQQLADVAQSLATLNIPLKCLVLSDFAAVPAALLALARQCQIQTLHFNDEYEWNERCRDQQVVALFEAAGIGVQRYTDQVLVTPGQLLTQQAGFYTVFTPFYRRWMQLYANQPPQPLPAPTPQATTSLTADPLPAAPSISLQGWLAGEEIALTRLAQFCDQALPDYQRCRDFPALPGTSQLSAWLAVGALSTRQCLSAVWVRYPHQVLDKQTGPGCWVSELLWREFYRHLLVGFPQLSKSRAFKPETEQLAWRDVRDETVAAQLAAWKAGQTGFPLVDAAMRQLKQTGWMHNRLRMLTAMFLSKHLLIDWRVGEAWFMDQLVDGDLASNNGGWQWAASTGTDAAPYFRLFNPYSQSQKFDPKGAFIRQYVPELAGLDDRRIHCPPMKTLETDLFSSLDYPSPIVDLQAARARVLDAFQRLKT